MGIFEKIRTLSKNTYIRICVFKYVLRICVQIRITCQLPPCTNIISGFELVSILTLLYSFEKDVRLTKCTTLLVESTLKQFSMSQSFQILTQSHSHMQKVVENRKKTFFNITCLYNKYQNTIVQFAKSCLHKSGNVLKSIKNCIFRKKVQLVEQSQLCFFY